MREEIARNLYVDTRGGLKPLVWTRDAFSDFMNALLHYREYEPFLDYLEKLPKWDGALAGWRRRSEDIGSVFLSGFFLISC